MLKGGEAKASDAAKTSEPSNAKQTQPASSSAAAKQPATSPSDSGVSAPTSGDLKQIATPAPATPPPAEGSASEQTDVEKPPAGESPDTSDAALEVGH